jgi:DNA-binding Lrp family transcriptional regulator
MTTILIFPASRENRVLDYARMISQSAFPEEPLDSRDRKLIQAIYREGEKGIGFNKLVGSTRGFASRSTVAVRIERLVRLGYLERSAGNAGPGKERPVRLTFRCFSFMLSVEKSVDIAAKLRAELQSIQGAKGLGEEGLKKWYDEFRERYNALFGLVGTLAVFYGTSAAGDLFLPLVVEDYKTLSAEFMSLFRERPELLKSLRGIIEGQAASKGVDLEEIRKKTRDELLGPVVYRFREWGELEPESGRAESR